jgi:hypothetical protein
LGAHKNFAGMNLFIPAIAVAAVNIWLGENQQFEPWHDSQFSDLIDADARAELG